MPTEKKVQAVEELRGWIERSTIAIATDYSGSPVSSINDLRRALREKGIEVHVVKNTLAYIAADAAGKPAIKEIVQGPTAIVFGYGDPTESARVLTDFIRNTRATLKIRGGAMNGRVLSPGQVEELATLPSREELVARLLGQLQAPIASLMFMLNAPISGLARVLQQHLENLSGGGGQAPAASPTPGEGPGPQAATAGA